MLGLELRQEFRDEQMSTAATALHGANGRGALDMAPAEFFDITYPSLDVQHGLRALGIAAPGRPVMLIAERGRGKTHVMAALHHALNAPEVADAWMRQWMHRAEVNLALIKDVRIRQNYLPITVSVQDNEYAVLWDILFRNHPAGQRFAGRFEASRGLVPARTLLEEMLVIQPTALIIDELQTWYDGRKDEPGETGAKYRSWAFNFIQTLAEIATDRPDLLLFIASVRNNATDAFQQINRNSPLIIDFKDPEARADRQRLVLHRLFQNRGAIPVGEVAAATRAYRAERFRLLIQRGDAAGELESNAAVQAAWPFTPELFTLLEDQILRSNSAQGLRDLLRTLADTYRAWGERDVILSPVHFDVTAPQSRNVDALLDAISSQSQHKLREVAKRNYDGIIPAIQGFPPSQVAEMLSDIWMRSFAAEAQIGATAAQLHLDMTHATAIDDNLFNDLLIQVVANAFNIHQINDGDQRRYLFREEENVRAVLLARARNDQLFSEGQDIIFLRRFIRQQLSPPTAQASTRVIVLGPAWETAPWEESLDDADRPEQWDRPILLVLPTPPTDINATLGRWLARQVPRRRNTLRYLLPEGDLFADEQLRQAARLGELVQRGNDAKFQPFKAEFAQALARLLEQRFTRFAFLTHWDYQDLAHCVFTVEPIREPIARLGTKLDEVLRDNFFLQEEFQRRAVALAMETRTVGALLGSLLEPPGDPREEAPVYLSEHDLSEQLLQLVARGTIALSVNGTWLARQGSENEHEALVRLRTVGFKTGRELREILLGLPEMVGARTRGGNASMPAGGLFPPPSDPLDLSPPPPDPLFSDMGSVHTPPWPPAAPAPETSPGVDMAPDDGATLVPPRPPRQRRVRRSSQPRRPINLTGELEQWGIDVRAMIPVARLEFTGISAAQLRDLLSRLPRDVPAVLEVEIEEEAQG